MTDPKARFTIGSEFDERGVKDALLALDRFGGQATQIGSKLSTLAKASALAFGAVQFTQAANEALKFGEALSDGAKKAGIQAGAFSQLAYAAGLSNVEISDLSTAFKVMQVNISKGGEEFRKFGVDIDNIRTLAPDKQFEALGQAVSEIQDPTNRAAAAVEFFGKQGANLLPLFENGAKGIRGMREEAVRLNIALSDSQVQSLAEAKDAVDRLEFAYQGLAATLTSKVAKSITDVFNALTNLVSGAKEDPINAVTDRIAELQEGIQAKGYKRGMGFDARVLEEKPIRGRANVALNASAMAEDQASLMQMRDRMLKEQEPDVEQVVATHSGRRQTSAADLAALAAAENPFGPKQQEELAGGQDKMGTDLDQQLKEFNDKNSELLEAQQKALADRLDAVREYSMTDAEIENQRHQERLDSLKAANEQGLILGEDYNNVRERLETEHADSMKSIRTKSMTDLEKFQAASFGSQVKTAVGAFADITAGISRQSKLAFELNKAAGIANVALAIPETVQNAYKWGSAFGGPIGGAAAAAVAFAASAANLAAIKSQSFGGGGGAAPSLAGSTPASPVTPVTSGSAGGGNSPGQLIVIEGLGDDTVLSGKQVRKLAEQLAELGRDGGITVRVA